MTRVLTDGFGLYLRVRRGVYHEVDRRGRRKGITCSGFEPPARWRPARVCCYDLASEGLTCPHCGLYDQGFAETGVRSYCAAQSGRRPRVVEA